MEVSKLSFLGTELGGTGRFERRRLEIWSFLLGEYIASVNYAVL
jgi:hypothetical protein